MRENTKLERKEYILETESKNYTQTHEPLCKQLKVDKKNYRQSTNVSYIFERATCKEESFPRVASFMEQIIITAFIHVRR